MEIALAALEPLAVARVERAGQAVLACRWRRRCPPRSLRDLEHGEDRPEDLLAGEARASGARRRRPSAGRSSPASGPALPPATIRPSFFPIATYSRIFFCAPRVDDGADGVLRIAHVADRQGASSSRRLRSTRSSWTVPVDDQRASRPSTSGPGSRTRRRRCRWRRPRCRRSRRRG